MTTPTPRRPRRSPSEIADHHRKIARKNDERYAAQVDPDVRLANSIIKKLVMLDVMQDDPAMKDAIRIVERVRERLIDRTLSSAKPGEGK